MVHDTLGYDENPTALLWQVQSLMEHAYARLEQQLRLPAAQIRNRQEPTTAWWARQSAGLHTGCELRLIRWRAVRRIRRMQRAGLLCQREAEQLQESLNQLFTRYHGDLERRLQQGIDRLEAKQDSGTPKSSWLLHN